MVVMYNTMYVTNIALERLVSSLALLEPPSGPTIECHASEPDEP